MVSWNKAQSTEQILKCTEGSVAITFDEDIGEEDENENMPSSDSVDKSSENEVGSGDGYVEHSFVYWWGRHTTSNVKVNFSVLAVVVAVARGGW